MMNTVSCQGWLRGVSASHMPHGFFKTTRHTLPRTLPAYRHAELLAPCRHCRVRASASKGSASTAQAGKGVIVEQIGRQQRTYHLHTASTTEQLQTEEAQRTDSAPGDDGSPPPSAGALEQATDSFKEFALPRGWPASVGPDYLPYQLWSVPTHVFGWLSVSLATSSLLKALGASPGAAGVAASAAAIKWITKDGIGAGGKLLVGGRFGGIFDEDPRRWRMVAEIFATLGQGLEIATAFFPGSFLLLAGGGNLSKAVGKGLGKPPFRIIQNHFALQGNLGDISAKEEVWEVSAQLVGIAVSVGVLKLIEASHTPVLVLPTWAASQVAHIALRYQSLGSLRFGFLNHRRACTVALAHVQTGQVPGVEEVNAREGFCIPPRFTAPRLRFGIPVQEAEAGFPAHTASHAEVTSKSEPEHARLAGLAEVFAGQGYMLAWHQGRGAVLLRQGCPQRSLLQAIWQAALLHHQGVQDASQEQLRSSLQQAEKQCPGFLEALQHSGWDVEATNIRTNEARLQW